MQEKMAKTKKNYYIKDITIERVKKMSRKHGLNQNQILERALNRELAMLEKSEPIIG